MLDCSHKIKKLINSQPESTASVASGTGVKLPTIDSLKEGTGKELRHLHDIVTHHLCALKSMDYDQSGPFITSMLELKLDATTQFEWQKHKQSEAKVPHYQDLLNFIDLRAQASEGSAIIAVKKPYHNFTSETKFITPGKPLTSFTSHHAAVSNQ